MSDTKTTSEAEFAESDFARECFVLNPEWVKLGPGADIRFDSFDEVNIGPAPK